MLGVRRRAPRRAGGFRRGRDRSRVPSGRPPWWPGCFVGSGLGGQDGHGLVGQELVSAGGGMEFGQCGVHVRFLSAVYRLVQGCWVTSRSADVGRCRPRIARLRPPTRVIVRPTTMVATVASSTLKRSGPTQPGILGAHPSVRAPGSWSESVGTRGPERRLSFAAIADRHRVRGRRTVFGAPADVVVVEAAQRYRLVSLDSGLLGKGRPTHQACPAQSCGAARWALPTTPCCVRLGSLPGSHLITS